MKVLKLMGLVSALMVADYAFAVEEHHTLTISNCRIYPNGHFEIKGVSVVDGIERRLAYPTTMFNEKSIDRYLSMCMTALSTGIKYRADYLECTGTSCAPKANTTGQLLK